MALCRWLVATVLAVHVTSHPLTLHKHKRQIFREQVSPHVGGKIPEDAFRTDRLALNRLNKEGISIPDGVLLEARHRESHHNSHRHDPAISASIVKLVQHPNGRYAPPEGHYPFDNLIESTYIIRPPWGHAQSLVIPPHKTVEVPLIIPHKPLYTPEPGHGHGLTFGEEDLLTFANQLDGFYPDLSGTKIWTGFGQLFHEHPARFLRQTKAGGQGLLVSAPTSPQGQYPRLTAIPSTSFTCGAVKGKMVADPEANCQVFHLCHTTGQKETFLCPQGMRYDAARSQCVQWTKVTCGDQR